MNEIYFTDEERLQLIGLAKEIVRLDPESIEPYGFRKVKDYIIKETGKHGLKRDILALANSLSMPITLSQIRC